MANGVFSFYFDEEQMKKVQKAFQGLADVEKDIAIKEAMTTGMRGVVAKGKTSLVSSLLHPAQSTGNLLHSMGIQFYRGKGKTKKGTMVVGGFRRSGASRAYKVSKRPPGGNHAHLVDRGTNERWQKTTGRYTGRVKGSRFWTRVVLQEGPKVVDKVLDAVEVAINRIYDRMV